MEPNAQPHSTDGSATGLTIHLDYLDRVAKGNQAFIQTMLRSFVDSVGEISSEIELMLDGGDRRGIGLAAHKVKFALDVVGVTALKEVVSFLEDQGKGIGEPAADTDYTLTVQCFIKDMRGLRERVKEMSEPNS